MSDLKNRLRVNGLAPNKRFGQNFLVDDNIIDEIIRAADISPEDDILEIGPGTGALTRRLREFSGRVVAVEIDKGLAGMLAGEFRDDDNVEVICGDILKLDAQALFDGRRPVKVVANLPYYITTPILLSLLPRRELFSRFVVMIQREVADRMTAAPGNKNYGALSLSVQFYTDPSLVTLVPPSAFYPRPEVTSAVLRLDVLKEPRAHTDDPERMFKIIRAAFGKRRKTLVNALCGDIKGITQEQVRDALKSLGLDEAVRGEVLTLEQFAGLSELL